MLCRDRPPIAGRTHAAHHLLAVVRLALAVFFPHGTADRFDPFVSGEALAARRAFSPSANRLAAVQLARVDHITIGMLAIWATHTKATEVRYLHLSIRAHARHYSIALSARQTRKRSNVQ